MRVNRLWCYTLQHTVIADVSKQRKRDVGQLRDLLVPIFLLFSSSISLLIFLVFFSSASQLVLRFLSQAALINGIWHPPKKKARERQDEEVSGRVKSSWVKNMSYYFISIINQHLEMSKVFFRKIFAAFSLSSWKRESFAIQSSRRNNTRNVFKAPRHPTALPFWKSYNFTFN